MPPNLQIGPGPSDPNFMAPNYGVNVHQGVLYAMLIVANTARLLSAPFL